MMQGQTTFSNAQTPALKEIPEALKSIARTIDGISSRFEVLMSILEPVLKAKGREVIMPIKHTDECCLVAHRLKEFDYQLNVFDANLIKILENIQL